MTGDTFLILLILTGNICHHYMAILATVPESHNTQAVI
jgi:hypothetical protein